MPEGAGGGYGMSTAANVILNGAMTRNQYRALHRWVEYHLGKPKRCDNCADTSDRMYDWANISGEYKRDLSDWKRLCRPCHMKMDGQHRKNNIFVAYNGKNQTLADWAVELGIKYATLYMRIKRGQTAVEALKQGKVVVCQTRP